MLFRAGDEDTICALSTPPGTGGIAVIRISGEASLSLSRKLCGFLPEEPESHRVYYGLIRSGSKETEPIDEVLVTYFSNGRSFTGEETVEIACHGGAVLSTSILNALCEVGCRLAKPGEFTYRAFMSGRLDLVQAESVLGLIESRSKQSAKVALRQLQGHLSSDFSKIEDDLVWILAHLEASIDFSTEDIDVRASDVESRAVAVRKVVEKLIATYRQGRILREGIEIALVGQPNAGKSSLLNAFLQEDRAIVTPHAGTTRDTIEGRITIAGVPVTFVDTAGLRSTENEIEKMGIERSHAAMKRADFIFQVIDLTAPLPSVGPSSESTYFLLNKCDLASDKQAALELARQGIAKDRILPISAVTRAGIDRIEAMLATLVGNIDSTASNIVTQARHLELLQKIHSCLGAALDLIKEDSSPEFIAFELQEAVRAIHELLGKDYDEQVIDRIFKEFCLGK